MEKNYESEHCSSQDINNPKFRSRVLRKMSDFTPDLNRDVIWTFTLKLLNMKYSTQNPEELNQIWKKKNGMQLKNSDVIKTSSFSKLIRVVL